ncbi:MAG: thermonuclease family protein [Desulfobulbaceae bacterium]|nr:thermonuclease family protein [Desulfobulbaceae bacterium]
MKYFIMGYLSLFSLFILQGQIHAHPGFLDANGGHACTMNCEKFGVAKGVYHKHTFSLKPPVGGSSGSSSQEGASSTHSNRKRFDPNYESGIVVDKVQKSEKHFSADDIAVITGIITGDTFKARMKQGEIEISLYGIEVPEPTQNLGKETAQALKETLLGEKVILRELDFTELNKARAVVMLDGLNINLELVKLGYAWVYSKTCRQDFCDEWILNQRQARKNKEGLWKEPNPISPWNWRKKQENE